MLETASDEQKRLRSGDAEAIRSNAVQLVPNSETPTAASVGRDPEARFLQLP